MDIELVALKFGAQLIETKLGQLMAPSMQGRGAPINPAIQAAELPTSARQKGEQSAKIHPPRVITTQ